MKPVIALVGRPNVGKSTLFNKLTRSRDAIVADVPGLTRDRQYGEVRIPECPWMVVDTGGVGENDSGIDEPMSGQSWRAVDEADLVLLLVDGRSGLLPSDELIANRLRSLKKPACLVVNKTDGIDPDVAMADFYSLGFAMVYSIAASQNRGVTSMMESLKKDYADFLTTEDEPEEVPEGVRIAVLGRPNVGKSTLVNRMLGEERVVVFDEAGTTRDSIYIPFTRHERQYVMIDTAGVRRRGRVNEAVEKFSVIKAMQAVDDSNVVLLVIDAREGIVDQDLHLLGYILEKGRALLIVVNKWDGMDQDDRKRVKTELDRRLSFIDYAKVYFISALHGTGVGDLFRPIDRAFEAANKRLSASQLTRILSGAVEDHPPPLVKGHRIKLRYAHMGGSNPPTIVIHGNQTESVPDSYRRYLESRFRKWMKVEGSPVRLEFRTGENPYAGRKNKLTQRQVNKRRRMMKHVKRKK